MLNKWTVLSYQSHVSCIVCKNQFQFHFDPQPSVTILALCS